MKQFLGSSCTVLFVDDEPDLLEVISESLGEHFQSCLTASDAKTAIELLKTRAVDIVVTDYMMPGMNGVELTKWVLEHCPKVPVIMLTGNSMNIEVMESLNAGAFDVVAKPFQPELIINRIQNCLLMPELLDIVWTVVSPQLSDQMNQKFQEMSYQDQVEFLYTQGRLLKTRGYLTRKVS